MKKFITALLLLVGLTSFSQENLDCDPDLRPLVEEFIEEASKRGYDVREQLQESVLMIRYGHLEYPLLGYYDGDTGELVIADFASLNMRSLRIILFHELGHAFLCAPGHSCYSCAEIMTAKFDNELIDVNDEEQWQSMLDGFFPEILYDTLKID